MKTITMKIETPVINEVISPKLSKTYGDYYISTSSSRTDIWSKVLHLPEIQILLHFPYQSISIPFRVLHTWIVNNNMRLQDKGIVLLHPHNNNQSVISLPFTIKPIVKSGVSAILTFLMKISWHLLFHCMTGFHFLW